MAGVGGESSGIYMKTSTRGGAPGASKSGTKQAVGEGAEGIKCERCEAGSGRCEDKLANSSELAKGGDARGNYSQLVREGPQKNPGKRAKKVTLGDPFSAKVPQWAQWSKFN